MDKKYLPSKIFIIRVVLIFTIVIIVFGVSKIYTYFKNRPTKKTPIKITTVAERIQKDSNNNGIPDFEEYLWGLDPTKNGPENKEFILAKKKDLIQSGDMTPADSSKPPTDNDVLSQQFFAAIVSLQQTGDLNQESMNSITQAVGKNVEAIPIPDFYTNSVLTIQSDSTVANANYRKALSKLVAKYADSDIGSELTIIIQGLNNKDPQALYAATTIADAYQSFGKELIKIPVPKSLSTTVLSAANNYEKTGQTIKDLAKILSDPIIGMKALINYKKYNDALASDLEKISETLQ
jgi:hypothetical protein